MLGAFRCTEEDYQFITDLAKKRGIASTEVTNVFLRAAIEEFKYPTTCKKMHMADKKEDETKGWI